MSGLLMMARRRVSLFISPLIAATILAGLAIGIGPAAAQGIGSPIGIQTAYGHLPARPWYADRPDYFNPFDFQWGDGRSWINGYAGIVAEAELSSILFAGDFSTGDVGLVGVSFAREIGSLGNALRFEWEIGGTLHYGAETFASFHTYFVARWIWFPWNKWLMTTYAIGTGPSIATKKSKYEAEDGEASFYKNGMMMELTFGLPEQPNWMLQARIHHRSSIFGVLGNAGSPSDYLTIGLKHRF